MLVNRYLLLCLLICSCTAESESSGNRGWLRSHRYIWAHREGLPGLQRLGHWAASLVRHAGQPSTPHRAVAHTQGPRRWREEGLSETMRYIIWCTIVNRGFDFHSRKNVCTICRLVPGNNHNNQKWCCLNFPVQNYFLSLFSNRYVNPRIYKPTEFKLL